jgi:hypothetical protein
MHARVRGALTVIFQDRSIAQSRMTIARRSTSRGLMASPKGGGAAARQILAS